MSYYPLGAYALIGFELMLNTGDEMNHNEMFADLQEKYYKTNNKKILEEMYLLLLEFYRNYITDYARKRGLKFTKETVDDLRTEMAERTISHYLKKPDFRIENLSAYGYFDFIKIITQNKTEDKNFSLEQLAENYDDNEPVLPNAFVNEEDIIDLKIDAEMSLKPMEFKTFCYLVENPNITEKDLEVLVGEDYKLILENVKLWIKEYLEC